jgi:pimeloyl-ACP methyl ester carboxylesterase
MKTKDNILKYRILQKAVYIALVFVFVSIFFLNTPDKVFGAVIYDSSNVGTSYNVSSYIFLDNLYMRFPYATSSYPYFPNDNAFTLTAPVETLRLKRISGVGCNVPTNINLFSADGNSLGRVYSGVTNGDFCDFPVTNINVGDKFIGIGLCVNGYCDGRDGDFILDGSDTNSGYSFNGNGQNPTPGGVAFQLCDVDGCSGGFNNPTPPPEPPCTENCNSNVMFLPGIEGSRLYRPDFTGEDRLWEPNVQSDVVNLFLNTTGTSIKDDIYAKTNEIIDEGLIPLAGFNVYKSFISDMNTLKSSQKINDWRAVPYDWRLSLNDLFTNGKQTGNQISYLDATSTPYIEQTAKELASKSKTKKVTIVAHSMGGIVAKELVKHLTEEGLANIVDKVILVAVPQVGTPQAIGSLLHGAKQGIPEWWAVLLPKTTARVFSENMPSAYNLLPSDKYFQFIDPAVVKFEANQSNDDYIFKYGYEIKTPSALKDFLLGVDGRTKPEISDLVSPNILNPLFIDSAKAVHDELDNWDYPSNIKIVQIAGWGEDTASGIEYYDAYRNMPKCSPSVVVTPCAKGDKKEYRPIDTEDGDGIVVTPSALVISTSTPNVERWWINLKKFNDPDLGVNRSHGDIFEVTALRNFVRGFIDNSSSTLSELITDSRPTILSDESKKLTYFLHSPLALSMYDNQGRHTGISTTTNLIEENIPNTRYREFGEVKYIINRSNLPVRIVMNGQSSGTFSFDIENQDNGTTSTTSFVDIPVSTTTIATLDMTDDISSLSNLNIDNDGNGTVDLSLKPKLGQVVNLPQLDSIAPESKITFSTSTDSIIIKGLDDKTLNPVVSSTATSSIITDEVGNTLKLVYTNKKTTNSASLVLSKLEYSTTTKTTVTTSATANYIWLKTTKPSSYLVFASFLKTPTESVVSVYDPSKKKTVIYSLPKDTATVDINSFVLKPLKNAIIKTTLNGMVVPNLQTDKGKILIKY